MDLAGGPDVLWEALTERTRLVWFETPSNPHLKVVDIAATSRPSCDGAAEGGRRPLIVVDNTFASPALQRPLTIGADIVFHSATKYLAGHSDTIVGVAVDLGRRRRRAAAVPPERDGRRAGAARLLPRPARAADAAPADGAPRRERGGGRGVPRGPGGRRRGPLPGVGRDGLVPAGATAVGTGGPPRSGRSRRRGHALFTLAESLGGVESLIEVPAAMTHLSVAGSPLEVEPALVRLSVGIEGADDLIADLARALDGA